jgi:hypothetical protein
MEAIWFVRMAKPKARREPRIPPCLEQLNTWVLLLLFFLLVLCCMNLPRSRAIRCLLWFWLRMIPLWVSARWGIYRADPRWFRVGVLTFSRSWERDAVLFFFLQFPCSLNWLIVWSPFWVELTESNCNFRNAKEFRPIGSTNVGHGLISILIRQRCRLIHA